MASRPTNVALRLGMEGGELIEQGLNKIGDTGSAAAKRLAADFKRAGEDIEQLQARQAAAGEKLAAIGGGYTVGADQNAQILSYTRYMAEQQRQAEALRNAIEPLRVAQAAYDKEIDVANGLLARGKISQEEHAAAVALSAKSLDEAKKRLEDHTNAIGLNRAQTIIAQSAVIRFTDAVIAGRNPLAAFALEAHKGVEVLAAGDEGLAGGLRAVLGWINPVTIAVGASAAVVAIGTAAWLSYTDAVDKLNAIAQGSGRLIGASGAQLEASAESAASAARITVGAARDIETAYVQTGKIGTSILPGLTAATNDFAAATGQKLDAATAALAAAFADPGKGATELTEKYGLLDASTLQYVRSLVEQGNETEAQSVLLKALEKSFDGAAEHANVLARAWHGIENAASNAFAAMGKAIDRALTGGPALDKLNSLLAEQQRRQSGAPMALSGIFNMNGEALSDQALADQIAKQRAEVAKSNRQDLSAKAHADVVPVLAAIDAYTGDDKLGDLQKQLSGVTRALADGGVAAGLNAQQIAKAREMQDAYTHAIQTYLPPAEKQRQLDALDAQMAAARTPAQKAELAAEKERVEQKGKVITAADAEAEAHSKGAAALATASKAGDKHAETLARDAASMDANARASLALADAYLQGGAAALVAEARRKALTDATKKGIDVDAEVQRQLAVNVGEAVAGGAKSVAQLRDETAARVAANDNVSAGTLALADMQHALSDEAALRPLLTLRTIAQGDALTKLTAIIGAYREALSAAHQEEKRGAALQAIDGSTRAIAGFQDQAEFAGDRSGRGEVEIARRAVERDSAKYGSSTEDVAAAKAGETRAKQIADQAKYTADTLNAQHDANTLAAAELVTVTMGADQRQIALDRVKATTDLEAHGIDLASDHAKAILAGVDAQDLLNQQLARASNAMQEVRDFGDQFVDDLKSGKNLASDLEGEFIKLAAINPLKNLINGNSALPTLSSVLGLFGSSGTSAWRGSTIDDLTSTADPAAFNLPHNAAGTEYWGGGATWVAENGPEIVNLPRGSSVTPAPQTRRIMQAANDRAPSNINHFHLEGAVLTQELVDQMNDIGTGAAVRGAAGGAAMAQAEARATGTRRLGRRW